MIAEREIQAAFFDVDGTLLSFDSHTVPASAVRSLHALHDQGVRIFIATGRSAANMTEISMLPYDGVIALNGTDNTLRDGTVISRHAIPAETFARFLALAERHGAAVSVENGSGVFVNMITPRVEEMSSTVALPLPRVANLADAFVAGATSQLCLFADCGAEAEIMAQFPELASSRWCSAFADINLAGFDKGTGLREAAAYCGFDASAVIAFGDGGNDIPMIKAAGIGVAMGNAGDAVKRSADFIAGTVEEDGIEQALRRFGII